MSSTTNNNNTEDQMFNCLDFLKTKPGLLDSDFDDIGCVEWNGLLLYITKDYTFFNFDELCRHLKRRKIKSWNNSSTWTSAFKTHFINSHLQERHPDRFRLIHGEQYVHVMYLDIACKGILNSGEGVEFFWGESDWDESCGNGNIYFIYLVGRNAFKFGKADDLEIRFTNYLSEEKDRKIREKGLKVLITFKVRNMSAAEEALDLFFKRNKFQKKDNSREYYDIPKLKGESDDDRYWRLYDIVFDAIESIEPRFKIGSIIEEAGSWATARLKLPAK